MKTLNLFNALSPTPDWNTGRCRLRSLASSSIAPWLQCPRLTISIYPILRNLDYHSSPHDSLSLLIHCIGRSVRSLKLNANDDTLKDFNFDLPFLVQLECQFTPHTVWNVIERMPDHSRLTELTLTTSHDQWQFNDGARDVVGTPKFGLPLERMVLRKLPCLRRVAMEVTVRPRRIGTQFPPFSREAVVQAIERSMPRLTKMRMVSVIFLQKDWYKETPLSCRRLYLDEGNFYQI
ncbi:hypothetical protein MSAN_00197500 [Mycena sanguinolenta]|uniref:Uncharacterized protein n=1 Tax=Mycena sanguinolenta TaxID=230812 RepID=A0A8H6ZEY1_9AGAR|nr:hypothetical protein MSAN_00197500 [Mycena sanguinolenta]